MLNLGDNFFVANFVNAHVASLKCHDLRRLLTKRLRISVDFDEEVATIIAELWALEHLVWNRSKSVECEVWGPKLEHPPTPGLWLTLYRAGYAEVTWKTAPRRNGQCAKADEDDLHALSL